MRIRLRQLYRPAIALLGLASSLVIAPVAHAGIYNFSSHTFTPCGATGQNGPTLANCTSSYSSATWTSDANNFTVTSGIQLWTVPASGTYQIQASGGQGSGGNGGTSSGGAGARVRGDFNLTQGTKVRILVGQAGVHPLTTVAGDGASGAGGGGSFVLTGTSGALDSQVLVIAAGGGGGNDPIYQGSIINGLAGSGNSSGTGDESLNGGSLRGGGTGGSTVSGGSFANGGVGGYYTRGGQTAYGGFGGGGANDDASTGGGGYVGGASGNSSAAFSKNTGANPLNESGVKTGSGQVLITLLGLAVPATAAISFSPNDATLEYRKTYQITATLSTNGRVSFYANNKLIPSCKNILSSSLNAYCSWKPSTHNAVSISVRITPTDSFYPSGTSSTALLSIATRTSKR